MIGADQYAMAIRKMSTGNADRFRFRLTDIKSYEIRCSAGFKRTCLRHRGGVLQGRLRRRHGDARGPLGGVRLDELARSLGGTASSSIGPRKSVPRWSGPGVRASGGDPGQGRYRREQHVRRNPEVRGVSTLVRRAGDAPPSGTGTVSPGGTFVASMPGARCGSAAPRSAPGRSGPALPLSRKGLLSASLSKGGSRTSARLRLPGPGFRDDRPTATCRSDGSRRSPSRRAPHRSICAPRPAAHSWPRPKLHTRDLALPTRALGGRKPDGEGHPHSSPCRRRMTSRCISRRCPE